jgi:cysteine desulfurase
VAFSLGQTGREWYDRAKRLIARYEDLARRTAQIAARAARDEIQTWLGSPNTPGTPAYRYNTVVSDVTTDVEAYTPPNYGAYDIERRQNRVEELSDFVDEFDAKVRAAERQFGLLPPPGVREVTRDYEAEGERVEGLRDRLQAAVLDRIDGVHVHGAGAPRLPNNCNLGITGVESEPLLLLLDAAGLAASSGSACQSGASEPSHVLRAMKVDPAGARGALRLTLGRTTTQADVDAAVELVVTAVQRLRR